MVEPQPSKLMVWVRFPSPAPLHSPRRVESQVADCRDLIAGLKGAHVAQLVEHVLGKDEVIGSIPVVGSSMKKGDTVISDTVMRLKARPLVLTSITRSLITVITLLND